VKKLIAMIATVAVVLSMGVQALAVGAVDKYTESPAKEKLRAAVVGEDNIVVDIAEANAADLDYFGLLKKLDEKVEKGQLARVFSVEIKYQVKVDEGKDDSSATDDVKLARKKLGAFTLRFTFNDAALTQQVYVNEGGDWVKLPEESWYIKDGKVYVNTSDAHFLTAKVDAAGVVYFEPTFFAFIVQPKADAANAKTAEDAAKGQPASAKAGGKASAATGYNSTAYIVCAIALAAGAAFFFGTSKKSAKEMM
jgi:hypothetical protein